MLPLNIAICEDNSTDAHILRDLIAGSSVSASVFLYESTGDFLAAFRSGFFQLVFLDIYFHNAAGNGGDDGRSRDADAEAGKPDGLDAAVKIREADPDIWIVFTTSSPVHAKFGYKVKADRYLDKPLDEEEVLSLLERAEKHFSDTSAEIIVTVDYKKHVIRQRDIRYVEIFNKQSVIHLENETVTTYINITEMEKLLTLPSFLRCHRCYIVNMDYIDGTDKEERDFIMQNGDRVYIGQNILNKVKKAHREHIVRLARGEKALKTSD